jgi:integrase
MARRKRLSDKQVKKLPKKDSRYTFADPELAGHYVRVFPSGAKSFVVVKANQWTTIGPTDAWPIEKARERARCIIRGEVVPKSVEEIIATYRKQEVSKMRSAPVVGRYLDMIASRFRGRGFTTIKRAELMDLANDTEEKHGRRSAEYVLITFGTLSRWYALHDEDYGTPMVRGMTRRFHSKARERILSDEEIRKVWIDAENRGDKDNFGVAIRLLLLTGQRREKVSSMRWDDVQNGTWVIRTEPGEKGNAGSLVLPPAALAILNAKPRVGNNPYILAARDGSYFRAHGRVKTSLDAKIGVEGWRLHDLRRTARSLMARAGVLPHVAERVLGHAIGGVEGIYDRHRYDQEKAHALEALARQIETIVSPPADNVTPIRKSA